MTKHYSPKNFFRSASNCFLQQYFKQNDVLLDVNFTVLTETKIEPVYQAWLALPPETNNRLSQDLQDIHSMATEGGSKAIIDEANWRSENLAEQFSQLKNFHDHAFWTFLERPDCWQGAIAFNQADSLPLSYWRKRKNMPDKPANVEETFITHFEAKLSEYFHTTQGRGQQCKIDCYKRGNFDYFFAYPEDYAQTSLEWRGDGFKRCSHHPAFETIFVYSQEESTLDICIKGSKKVIPELQNIFARCILNMELLEDEEAERVYDLDPLKSRNFQFSYEADSGIIDVAVSKLRFMTGGGASKKQLTLEASPTVNNKAVYDLLEDVSHNIPLSQMYLVHVGFKVIMSHPRDSNKTQTKSFSITYPNSCSLKHDQASMVIRKMLVNSGIEPRVPLEDNDEAA